MRRRKFSADQARLWLRAGKGHTYRGRIAAAHRITGAAKARIGEKPICSFLKKLQRQRGAKNCFLEVGAENTAARALYQKCGYAEQGLRKAYYRKMNGTREDALVLAKTLA